MPANTPILGLPYPVPADPIDTAGDIQRLAESLDAAIKNLPLGYSAAYIKQAAEGFNNTAIFPISSFNGVVANAHPTQVRRIQVQYSLEITNPTQPTQPGYVVIGLFLGAGIGGMKLGAVIHPWDVGQASSGVNTIAFQGRFNSSGYDPLATVTLCIQLYNVLSFTVGTASRLECFDQGGTNVLAADELRPEEKIMPELFGPVLNTTPAKKGR